ncbi:hypothetical protein [Ralstonia phage RP13]|nr:hypothetical protein [Ralstonia phage RP13]
MAYKTTIAGDMPLGKVCFLSWSRYSNVGKVVAKNDKNIQVLLVSNRVLSIPVDSSIKHLDTAHDTALYIGSKRYYGIYRTALDKEWDKMNKVKI